MGRRPTIDETKLLETARAVFAELGPTVSTEVVAKRAGVSVGSLFRRWPTKDALLAAVARPAVDEALLRDLADGAGHSDVRAALVAAGERLLESFRVSLPARMLAVPASGTPTTDPDFELVRALASWFAEEMARGRLRRADAEVAARSFTGALAWFALSERHAAADSLPLSAHTFVRGLADLLVADVPAVTPAKLPRPARR